MPSHFVVEQTEKGFNVAGRDIYPSGELIARRLDMLRNGWSHNQVKGEIELLEGWKQLNKTPVPNQSLVNEYLFTYVSAGDYIEYCGKLLYVQEWGRA